MFGLKIENSHKREYYRVKNDQIGTNTKFRSLKSEEQV